MLAASKGGGKLASSIETDRLLTRVAANLRLADQQVNVLRKETFTNNILPQNYADFINYWQAHGLIIYLIIVKISRPSTYPATLAVLPMPSRTS